jgi:hypothetical protein
MTRIGTHLITKAGWRPCAHCRTMVEYGWGCTTCGFDRCVPGSDRPRIDEHGHRLPLAHPPIVEAAERIVHAAAVELAERRPWGTTIRQPRAFTTITGTGI